MATYNHFYDLPVYKICREFRKKVSTIVNNSIPQKEEYRLKSQILNSSRSITANIAEGFERTHLKEKIQFYNVARASGGEIRSLIYVVNDIYPALKEYCEHILTDLNNTGKLISGLIKSTAARINTPNSYLQTPNS